MNRNQSCAAAAASSAFVVGASIAQASFVGFFVSSNQVSLGGNNLIVYTLTARFDQSSDTVFRALDLYTENPAWLEGFWHKDNHGNPSTNGLLSQEFGTWNPRRTGSVLANRPYDSYLTIGGIARPSNVTQVEGAWFDGNKNTPRVWDQANLPMGNGFSWYNEESSSVYLGDEIAQGRVGNSPGVAPTDVRLGQFVLSEGHEARTFSMSILYRSGYSLFDDNEYGLETGSGSFTLANPIPGPGALALTAIACLLTRSRRRS